MPKVLLIGLDGASWRVLEPWARAGRLPHVAKLMQRGAWGNLRSTIPALTMPAWSSLMTGRNPGSHGIYAFWRLNPEGYDPGRIVNANDLRGVTLWELVGRGGCTVGVINMPPSYPLRPVNGYLVGCMLTPPGAPLTYPPDVQSDLGEYYVDRRAPRGLRNDRASYVSRAVEYLRGLAEQTRCRTEATLRLLEKRPTDLLAVVFYAPDRVQHNFWDELDLQRPRAAGDEPVVACVEAVMRTLDDAIGSLVAAAGADATVILASDHGFVPKPERVVRVNRWLAEQGFLRQRPLWSLRRKAVRKLFPPAWRKRYDTVDFIQLNRAKSQAWAETIDYGTVAIWVHVRGRYPLGCVTPGAEYESVRRRVRDGLASLRDEAGRSVFRAARLREEVYHGAELGQAPDVVAVCDPRYGVVNMSLRRDLRAAGLFGDFSEAGFTGVHELEGIYLLAGPQVHALGRHQEYPIESIAPTVLYLLGLPVPRGMDGVPCTSALRAEVLARRPVAFTDEDLEAGESAGGWPSAQDEADVAAHLRALGYLE